MNMYIVWAVAIIVFGILEGITAQLVSIWFVVGAIAGLIAAICNVTLIWQVLIFIIVTVIALLLTRPLVKKFIRPKIESTNADRCIGNDAIVTEKINNLESKGQVKVNGNLWTARSSDGTDYDRGCVVTVEKIEGVKLIVTQKK